MNLFGLGKGKPVPFLEFRDKARLALRRREPGAQIVPNDNGFRIIFEDARPIDCNLRNLYADYVKAPGELENILKKWTDGIAASVESPEEVTWEEAIPTLRPVLKDAASLELARAHMKKAKSPDGLPSEPFLGDLQVIVMREMGATLTGVTQITLDAWGVTLQDALRQALNNMNLMSFPAITSEMRSGGKGVGGEVVGLIFEQDHSTAVWLLSERFRDFATMRLQGDCVILVPNRDRLIAIRADEPGLISSIQQANRSAHLQPHFLTTQVFHVHAGKAGGTITLHHPGGQGPGIAPGSFFA